MAVVAHLVDVGFFVAVVAVRRICDGGLGLWLRLLDERVRHADFLEKERTGLASGEVQHGSVVGVSGEQIAGSHDLQ